LEIEKEWPDDAANVLDLIMFAPRLSKPIDPQIHIDRIYALHAAGKYPKLVFKREQFLLGDKGVVVDECFAVTEDQPRKYFFTLISLPDNKKVDRVIIGSDAELATHLRNRGIVDDADHPYFVAAERTKIVSYGLFRNLPPYKEVREVAVEIFSGKRQPQGPKLIETAKKDR
jgi:hypothetical protein